MLAAPVLFPTLMFTEIPVSDHQVRPTLKLKSDVSAALVMGWARMIAKHGKGGFADKLEVDPKTVARTMSSESTPELHTALNSLLVDEAALNELFALYGFHPPRRRLAEPANDMVTVSGLSGVVSQFCEALKDGERNHRETLDLADAIKALMPALTAILNEANRIRGLAA